ncbi:neuraminidase-like domain-containing protein [Massilia rubra]|uniref:Virulence plasmid A protein n=1 Tax=Massilia rubra TaxID=2607910 RepID=A0ABX0LGK5_9BURK|nr:neuraminidase-like domain-containing protein [Massilia rubra]NHZ33387.1 hypothetical protein [Massilia rubra]
MARQIIEGLLIDAATRVALPDLLVQAWLRAPKREDEAAVGEATSGHDGRFAIALDYADDHALWASDVYFKVFIEKRLVEDTRQSILKNPNEASARVLIPIGAQVLASLPALDFCELAGVVSNELGVGLAELRIELVERSLGKETVLAIAVTDGEGRYSMLGDLAGRPRADLLVRARAPGDSDNGNGKELARSDVFHGADAALSVDLVVAADKAPRSDEFLRLSRAIARELGSGTGVERLDAAGVHALSGSLRWDPRMIAMGATAARLSSETSIPAEHYYALLRSGVAGDAAAIHRLPLSSVEARLKRATDDGVIGGEQPIERTLERYQSASIAEYGRYKAPAAVSSLGELLAVSLESAQVPDFLDAFAATADRPADLWKALARNGIDANAIERLRTDGKLGFLTRQNAPLVKRLGAEGIRAVEDLVGAGLYEAEAWKRLIDADVPEGVSADAYASGLAAQVQLSFGSQVMAEMVRRKHIDIGVAGAAADEVTAFFRNAGARIGAQAVSQWKGFDTLSPQAKTGARRVERLYQLTPSNDAMKALSRAGVDSAMEIARLPRAQFMARFGGSFPSIAEAALVYRKAIATHSATLHLATGFLTARGMPNVYGITGRRQNTAAPLPAATPGAPLLEQLLGNLDYCACDECKSVLGAAAYFVELLQFIDLPHLPGAALNPQAVLFGRRPDLQHLLLSCENTNIALPYVDLINEVLEHYIVSGSLAGFQGFNLREDSSAPDLLADPEHVADAAYVKTKEQVYPHGLPFDLPLAALRLLMRAWGTTLADALGVFGSAAAARRERIGLNAAEYSILTDTGFRALPAYFGESAGMRMAELNKAVADSKTFCRRTGISADELAAVLRTRFINPGYPLVALLTPLQVSMGQVQALYDGTLSSAKFSALLPPALDLAPYHGGVVRWLHDHRELILKLITLTDVGGAMQLRLAQPDNAADQLGKLDYHKLLRFIRLWKKLGWPIALTDRVLNVFLGMPPEKLTDANLDTAFTALLDRIANFLTLGVRQSLSAARLADWVDVFDSALAVPVRQERLARLLRIGLGDLVRLSEISGIDPLAADMAADAPSLPRFLDAWQLLQGARLKVADLDYLLCHADDSAAPLRDLKALRDNMGAVTAPLGAPAAGADLAQAHARMAQVYDRTVADHFIGLVGRSGTYRAALVTVEEALPARLGAVDARLGLDPFARQLTYRGILPAAVAAALGAAADALTPAEMDALDTMPALAVFIADFKAAVRTLAAAGQADLALLAAGYPELKTVYDAVAGIADPGAQAGALIAQVTPALQRGLESTALRGTLAALLKTPLEMVEVLTGGPDVLRAAGDASAGVLEDFRQLNAATPLDADGVHLLHIDPPATDNYLLFVAAPPGTVVTLMLGAEPAIPASAVGASGEIAATGLLALSAGVLTGLALTLAKLPAGQAAQLRWRTNGMAKAPVPPSRIYAAARLATARLSLLRLHKAALLSHTLSLTPKALAYLAAGNTNKAGILNQLDVTGKITGASLHALWNEFAELAWLAQMKVDDANLDTWASLLERPGQVTPTGRLVLAAAAGWTDDDLNAVLAHFGLDIDSLGSIGTLRQVKQAVDLAMASGQRAVDLAAWSVAAPDQALIAAIKQSLRQHQDAAAWRATLQDVNDALRNQRRGALVSYILHHQAPLPGIDTADKLYEHFLIDVEMDACMLTSRIRLALSTVQLFVTRCLMGLEDEVKPAAIDAVQWAWMRRYRVWQANRKIFLFPENWLEPELRDDKSPFFRELEAELLKSDITDELAEDAYLGYLKKLDDVARLEVTGSCLQEGKAGTEDDILHVFGRTNGFTREHYYRRFEGGYWTPWEKVSLNIEGEFVLPVVWKNQLCVFWLMALPKPAGVDESKSPQGMAAEPWTNSARLNVEISVAFGQYYRGKWSAPKSSELHQPIRLTGLKSFDPAKLQVMLRTHKPGPEIAERLTIGILYLDTLQKVEMVFSSKNAAPLVSSVDVTQSRADFDPFLDQLIWQADPSYTPDFNRAHAPGKVLTLRVGQPAGAAEKYLDETLLTKTDAMLGGFQLRSLIQPTTNRWNAPLFYSDERVVFFINPTEQLQIVVDFDSYYRPDFTPVEIKIPRLEVGPRPGPWPKPPIDPRGDPLVQPRVDPRVNPEVGPRVNPRAEPRIDPRGDRVVGPFNQDIERIIQDDTPFVFGGAVFDAGGMVKGRRQ